MRTLLLRILPLLFIGLFCHCDEEKELFKYIHSVRITYIPLVEWDDDSNPDIMVRMKERYAEEWEFFTNIDTNNNYEYVVLYFTPEVKARYEKWEVQIVDYDEDDNDDVMFSRIFKPGELGLNGVIPFIENQIPIMEIYYDERY
jgi:hypothetical protein